MTIRILSQVAQLAHGGADNDISDEQEKINHKLLYGDPDKPESIATSITGQILAMRGAKEDRREGVLPRRFIVDRKEIVRAG